MARINAEKTKAEIEVTKKEAEGMVMKPTAACGGGSSGGS